VHSGDAVAEPDSALDAFLAYLHYERRLSPRTLTGYRRDLACFLAWLDEHGIGDCRGVDSQHVRSYAAGRKACSAI
jgi:integrase/recombinase XerC